MIKIALSQMNSLMGDLKSNQQKILKLIQKARQKKADLIVFPEMAISAYLPLDLINRNFFLKEVQKTIKKIHQELPPKITALLGGPSTHRQKIFNSVFWLKKNQAQKIFSKQILADHNVFDETRYFTPGRISHNFFYIHKKKIQILICEEMWQIQKLPINKTTNRPDLIICLNASPFHIHKPSLRQKKAQKIAQTFNCPFIYLNTVGAHEELIFDGGSFALNAKGQCIHQMPFFKESFAMISTADLFKTLSLKTPLKIKKVKNNSTDNIKKALIFGIQEFVKKNHFQKVHLGLSGGIDSTLTTWLSVRALGVKNLTALFLPGPFTSPLSFQAVKKIEKTLKLKIHTQSITSFYKKFLNLWGQLLNRPPTLSEKTKENLQARIRSLYLMTWSNQHPQSLLLGTANKTELSLGYGTLYGDLSCGLFPIGDLFKTEIYKLAERLKNPPIPSLILNRFPSAELRLNQQDTQDLPADYPTLDRILKKLIEQKKDPLNTLEKNIFQTMCQNEFKRKQAAPILKVKEFSFDRGWRWPLSIKNIF